MDRQITRKEINISREKKEKEHILKLAKKEAKYLSILMRSKLPHR